MEQTVPLVWKPGNFYTLEGKPLDSSDPVMKAVITQPGRTDPIELVIYVADIPLMGAPYGEDEMEKAKAAAEAVLDRFWPSDEVIQIISGILKGEGPDGAQ